MTDRTYRPDDIKRILERALELQEASADRGEMGLTLAELEEVARASGIQPAFIGQAAAEMNRPDTGTWSESSTHVFAERIVDGVLTDEAWTDLVVELRRRSERGGESAEGREERHGATRAWFYVDGDDVKTQLFVTPREGRLHIRLSQSVGFADSVIESLVWSAVAAVVLGSIGTQLVDGLLFTVLAFVAAFLLSFPVIFGIDRKWRATKRSELDSAADALATLLTLPADPSDAAPGVPARASARHDETRLDVPESDMSDPEGRPQAGEPRSRVRGKS